ncbi:MAG: methylated-DNA--[protein]-cysteine S-methyltransferase [Xanthomonadaceae bacterium]|nr:methylated-DNA--[protein]-cysteine S-methyltransferase [Xanthomonadaceae bacterium]MDZ4116056.1 methylated-DNA--[protein]-cysteine S-methyltransferase [Xanthomonadaceae bacterium]
MMMIFEQFDTPVGVLTLAAEGDALCHIEFPSNRHPVARTDWSPGSSDVLHEARQQLREYFAGTRRAFTLPLRPRGTAFQMRVWQTLAQIPFGHTWSYKQLALACGSANAVRAVGGANGRNPLPIVLPCHRVIGADGSLTGFGGGIETKAALLRLEGALRKSTMG